MPRIFLPQIVRISFGIEVSGEAVNVRPQWPTLEVDEVRRSLNQYSRPGWWRSSADFSDLNDFNMRGRKPLYPFESNSLKTRVRAALPDSKNRERPAPKSVPCVVEDAAVYVKWLSQADKPGSP